MRLQPGMMLDLIKLGQGLVVDINKTYESTVGKHPYALRTDDRVILTNKYEASVLIDGVLKEVYLAVHYELRGDLCRIEWRLLHESPFGPSGLAEILYVDSGSCQ